MLEKITPPYYNLIHIKNIFIGVKNEKKYVTAGEKT